MEAFVAGWWDGIAGVDPRLCPYEHLSREWQDWHRAHRLAVVTFRGESCACCDRKLKPTHCTDGYFHLLPDGQTIPCTIARGKHDAVADAA